MPFAERIFTRIWPRARDASGAPYTLGKNYRSTEGLVKAVNQVFGAGAGHPQGAFLFQDRIPFVEVAAEGRKDLFRVHGKPVNGHDVLAASARWDPQ